jgi:hypothetical protein
MSSRPELKVNHSSPPFRAILTLLQVDDEGGFIRFFKALPVEDGDTVRVFDRGDWYTAHGDDAAFIARTVSFYLAYIFVVNHLGLQNYVRSAPIRQE